MGVVFLGSYLCISILEFKFLIKLFLLFQYHNLCISILEFKCKRYFKVNYEMIDLCISILEFKLKYKVEIVGIETLIYVFLY